MGDFSFSASARSSLRAPAQPEPQSKVTRRPAFSMAANCPTADSEGRIEGFAGSSEPAGATGASLASHSAVSPEITSTQTQRSDTARRMAISSTRGICAGLDTSSQ